MKQQEPIKIDVEDIETETAQADTKSIPDELRDLGQQFAETIQNAWNSEERVKLEDDIKLGFKNFGEELNTMFNKAKESDAAQRIRDEASRVEASDAADKVRQTISQGIQWLSEELAKLSEKLDVQPPAEKSPDDVSDTAS